MNSHEQMKRQLFPIASDFSALKVFNPYSQEIGNSYSIVDLLCAGKSLWSTVLEGNPLYSL